jgi:hypothetical protein
MQSGYKNLSVHEATKEKIVFLASAAHMGLAEFIALILDPIFQVGLEFPNDLNLESMISILSHRVTFDFSGRSTLCVGQCSEKELEALKNRMFEKAKSDIEEARKQ